MCHINIAYSEAILVNYPNNVQLESLQGHSRLSPNFIPNLLRHRSHGLQNLWSSRADGR